MAQHDFKQVYDQFKEKVWNLVSRYVNTRQDKEDLFQEVFLKLYKALPSFRGDAALETWIYRIAVNTSINHLKRQKRYSRLMDVLAGMRMLEKEERDYVSEDILQKPLEKLNPRQKMILLLSDVEEKTHEEIAKMLNVPLGTVKSNLHRAREIVRKELEKNDKL